MSTRRTDDRSASFPAEADVGIQPATPAEVGIQAVAGTTTPQEFERLDAAERRYQAAHTAWTDALRASRGGGPAELARLGIAQQAYEEAKAALERISDEAAATDRQLARLREERLASERRAAAIAGQADAWSRVRAAKPRRRGLAGLLDRLTGRHR
jgi:hypothetical protein